MKGYFISEEKAIELGLLKNLKIRDELQKTFVAITDRDVFAILKNESQISDKLYEDYADWFYKNYYNSIIYSIGSEIESSSR